MLQRIFGMVGIAFLSLVASASAAEKVRVACVGDSITFGACVADREQNCYPAVLGRLLGDGYDVRNFGVSGATLLKKGDLPYTRTSAFKQATEFQPNVVIIKLGSNDTKPQNWRRNARFAADYQSLIKHFRTLDSNPTIYIVLPVPALKDGFGITEKVVLEQQPIIKKIAADNGLKTIDLHSAINQPEQFDGDGIHPNAAGAKAMAEIIAAAVK